jgi:hypothetical protein
MNKELLNQIPMEEQPLASNLNSLIEDMQPSQAFQWELENQLKEKASSTRPAPGRFAKILLPVGWAIAGVGGVLLLNWVFGSLVPQTLPAAGTAETREVSFADSVRAGDICAAPLALAHGFGVFLTNPDKTGLVALDAEKSIGELRSFAWSPDGKRLALVGNSMGSGNISLTDSSGTPPQPILPKGELGYLMDAAWSRDGTRFAMWSSQNNRVLYVMNSDGTDLVEKRLNVQILGAPQFWSAGSRIVFYGADQDSAGLFEMMLTNSDVVLINSSVEGASSYTFSPDGSALAYMEYDRALGEARLVLEELTMRDLTILGTLPIPKGSGSSVPETANLSWSADGKSLVFDFGRSPGDRAIYLAHADGTGLIKIVDSAYAPSISADGKCLAYIGEDQVFLMDLTDVSSGSTTSEPLLLAELPTGRGTPNFKQDKLQWGQR